MGIEALIRTLQQCATLFEIVESALCTLRHLTCRHPDVEASLNSVRLNCGIPLICSFLNFHSQPLPVIKATLGLLRNLGSNPANLAAFREQAVVNNVCMYFVHSFQQVQQAQQAKADPPIIDGVSSMDIVECSTATLHMLSKDALNRNVGTSSKIYTCDCNCLIPSNLVKCTWNGICQESPYTYPNRKCWFELYIVVPALLAALQFSLGLSDLSCFRENMTELSPDLRQLPGNTVVALILG
ncbi:junction plakoglobin [Trichinella spiralis]|uniref:junction plakoglobin n=1 Tax=Trichinella spiralis TaxID=6334 RepID=UPI0001EFB530|nr:junction plakoglobin [Trichinella spiralis]